jgi:hypothetical protein
VKLIGRKAFGLLLVNSSRVSCAMKNGEKNAKIEKRKKCFKKQRGKKWLTRFGSLPRPVQLFFPTSKKQLLSSSSTRDISSSFHSAVVPLKRANEPREKHPYG